MQVERVPESFEDSDKRVGELKEHIRVNRWRIALHVATFVIPGTNNGINNEYKEARLAGRALSASEYAEQAHFGITNHKSVLWYHSAWMMTHTEHPVPGETEIPEDDFPTKAVAEEWRKKNQTAEMEERMAKRAATITKELIAAREDKADEVSLKATAKVEKDDTIMWAAQDYNHPRWDDIRHALMQVDKGIQEFFTAMKKVPVGLDTPPSIMRTYSGIDRYWLLIGQGLSTPANIDWDSGLSLLLEGDG